MKYRLALFSSIAIIFGILMTFGRAADLPIRKAAPTTAPVANWTGCYLGINVGAGIINNGVTTGETSKFPIGNLFPGNLSSAPRGWMLGGQAGCNQQVTGAIVLGIETDIDWTDFKDSASGAVGIGKTSISTSTTSQVNWLGTTRARLGLLPYQHVMVAITGGVAYGDVNVGTATAVTSCIIGCGNGSASSTKFGWTVGPEITVALDNQWYLKADALYFNLGSMSGNYTTAGPIPVNVSYSSDISGWIGRLGISRKF